MAGQEHLFKISLEEEMKDVYYFQQISHEKEKLIFKVPWGGAIIRNSLSTGEILNFRTVKEYEIFRKEKNKQLWLLLPLKVFRNANTLFGAYCCPQCDSMAGTDKLSIDHDPGVISSRLCVHSKVCSTILEDWRTIWEINVSPQDQVFKIVCNENVTHHTFKKQTKEDTLLAAVRSRDEVAVLYTVTVRQDTPICSLCVTKKCPHANSYMTEEEEQLFVSRISRDDEPMVIEQDPSDQTDYVSDSGSDVDVAEGQAERGKHKNYWVNIFINLCNLFLMFCLISGTAAN